MIKNIYWSSCKVPVRPLGAEPFHAIDGRTEMTKLIATFVSFSNTPKSRPSLKQHYSDQEGPTFIAKGRVLHDVLICGQHE